MNEVNDWIEDNAIRIDELWYGYKHPELVNPEEEKLSLKGYDPIVKKHVVFNEEKMR